jgi:hypothetical protein
MSSVSGSNFQKVPDSVSDPTFFLKKYDFKGPEMAFQNIIFKEYWIRSPDPCGSRSRSTTLICTVSNPYVDR